MRCGWLIATISSLAMLVSVLESMGQESQAGRIRSTRLSTPPPEQQTPDQVGPLAEVIHAFDSGQYDVPAEATTDELLGYLGTLTVLRDDLTRDVRRVQTSITRAQGQAAARILAQADGLSDEDFYLAAKLGLSSRISQIPGSSIEEQRRTIGLVARQLTIGATQGFRVEELRNVTRTMDYMERHGDPELAFNACAEFTNLLRASDSKQFEETISLLERSSRRLSLLGKPIELSGQTIEGRTLRWADYQDRVVLINFWATWSVPSIAELPFLKRRYQAYRDSGFEIIGVSLDNDRSAVEQWIAREQIPWINLYHDQNTGGHPMALKFGIRSIPSGLLLDQQGNVVSINARGLELDRLLARLLGPRSFFARELTAQNRWSEAAEELQHLVSREPQNLDYRVALGTVQLMGSDLRGYRSTCRESWVTLMIGNSPPPIGLLPLFCLSNQPALTEEPWNAREIDVIAKTAHAASNSTQTRLANIMSAFCAGRYQECLEERLMDGDSFSLVVAKLFQAMAAHRLGDAEQAARWLTQARSAIVFRFSDSMASNNGELPYEYWICCLVAKWMLLQAESELQT